MNEERVNFNEEFPEGATEEMMEETNIDLPEGSEMPAQVERETYELADGSQGSRAAFIREKFLQDNLSRKEISEKFGFPYRVVYSATVNMTNSAEAPARGRSALSTTLDLNGDGQVVMVKEDGVYVDGVKTDATLESLGALEKVNRNEWVKAQIEAGASRGDIAKKLDISYGVIYSITKDQEGTRQRIEITDENGNTMSRSEYIRQQFAAGKSRGEIAKELDVSYNVVWQATKTTKSVEDQFKEFVATFKKFQNNIEDQNLFQEICDALDNLTIVETEVEEVAEPDEVPEAFE